MSWIIKIFVILLLVIHNVISVISYINNTANNPILNIIFICRSKLLGSTLMRGVMMKDALNALGMNSDVIYSYSKEHNGTDINSTELQITSFVSNYSYLSACIFVKYFDIHISRICKRLHGVVLFDVLDDDSDMDLFYKMIHWHHNNDIDKDNKHKLQMQLKSRLYHTKWLMQTDYLTNFANQIGIKSYTLPHQHSNLNKWGLSIPTNHSNPLVIGVLYGNRNNRPYVKCFLDILCKLNVELWLINQQIRGNIDGINQTISTRVEYKCKGKTTTQLFINNRSFSNEDIYGQAVYYNDVALHGIDIGLLLPRNSCHIVNSNYSKGIINNVDMLRPQTRFLHWLSRGVPTLYYPTKAYKELAAKYNYGHSVDMELSVITAKDILKAVKLLQSYKRRQTLSIEGLAIAENYKTQNIASNLISIIQDVQMKLNRTSSRKYISKQITH